MKGKFQKGGKKVMMVGSMNGGSRNNNNTNVVNDGNIDEKIESPRSQTLDNIQVGRFRVGNNLKTLKIILIPAKMMLENDFSFDHIFEVSDFLKKPASVIFNLNCAEDPKYWNVRLPPYRGYLQKYFHNKINNNDDKLEEKLKIREKTYTTLHRHEDNDHHNHNHNHHNHNHHHHEVDPTIEGDKNGKVIHYQGVIRENCKRILQGTVTACLQAGAHFRTSGTWNGNLKSESGRLKGDEDFFAQTVASTGNTPVIFGASITRDFHPEIFDTIMENVEEVAEKVISMDDDIVEKNKDIINLDVQSFYDKLPGYITYEDHDDSGISKNSFPHPNITHLIISDNREILENKIMETFPHGIIAVNGDDYTTIKICKAVQLGWPIVVFKYTGGSADLFAEMHEHLDQYLSAKLYKTGKIDGHLPQFKNVLDRYWLKPFDDNLSKSGKRTTVLMENWSDRFNPTSVFIVDLFKIAEDEVQDRITQTMSVVTEAHYELGALASEQKRLTYAWRVRHKFVYNAVFFSWLSDALMILITLVTMSATISAVLYTFIILELYRVFEDEGKKKLTLQVLLQANLLLPLIATVFRGIYSSLTPNLKYVALKNAAMEIESEIYCYRTKVGRYSTRKKSDGSKDKKKNDKDKDKKEEKSSSKARVQFSIILDQIWSDLAASDLQNGSLRTPHDTSQALSDINYRIQSNVGEQDCYLKLIGNLDDIEAGKRKKDKQNQLLNEFSKRSWYQPILNVFSFFATNTAKIGIASVNVLFAVQLKDDGVSPLSAEEYVRLRMIPTAAYYSSITPGLSLFLHFAGVISVFLSVASSALSSFSLSAFLPAVLAFSGSLTDWMNYRQIELRLIQTNSALNGINKLLVWWECLSMIEKRNIFNKETLVRTTEEIIKAQATIFSGSSSKKRDTKDDDDDDDDDDGKKK